MALGTCWPLEVSPAPHSHTWPHVRYRGLKGSGPHRQVLGGGRVTASWDPARDFLHNHQSEHWEVVFWVNFGGRCHTGTYIVCGNHPAVRLN